MLLYIQVKHPLKFERKQLIRGNKCSYTHKLHCSNSMPYDKTFHNFQGKTIQQTIYAITNQFSLKSFSLSFTIIFQSKLLIILLKHLSNVLLPILLFSHSSKYCLHINHKYPSTFALAIQYIYLNGVKVNYGIQEESLKK